MVNFQASSCDYNFSHFDRNESGFECSGDEDDQPNSESQESQNEDVKPVIKEEEDDSEEDIPLVSFFF